MTTMTTLSEAVERLTGAGYTAEFRAEPGGLRAVGTDCLHAPESLRVDEIVRFEGASDPQDESMLLALSCAEHGLRGTWVVAFGPGIPPRDAEMVHRLPATRRV